MNLRTLIRGHRVTTVTMAALSTMAGLAEATFLVVATRLAFAVTNGREELGVLAGRTLTTRSALVLAVVLVAIRVGGALLSTILAARMNVQITASLRMELTHAYLQSSWLHQQSGRAGRLQELMTGYAGAGSTMVSGFTGLVSASFGLLALLGLAIAVDPLGALGVIVAVGVLGSGLRPLRKRIRSQSKKASATQMAFATGVGEITNLGLEMQVFGVQRAVAGNVAGLVEDGSNETRRLAILSGTIPHAYTSLAYLALVGALALASATDQASLTSLGAVMLVMLRSLSYGQQIQVASSSISSTRPYVEEFGDAIDSYRNAAVHPGAAPVASLGALELQDVFLEYSPGIPVLRNVVATIEPGEVVGIIGPSGSGKSTLVQLLLGLLEPTAGKVLAGGRDIRDLNRAEWVRKVTFVPQSPRMIRGTIADNIRFFREGITDAEVERAAQLAHLGDEIEAWPDRYLHDIGEGGAYLSGGQQQRLCLARALVERPELLILDEPTSSLDVRSESLIRQTLAELRHEMTIVIIAHRMSTLEICDRLMVVQGGELKAFDTPQRLAADSAFYRDALELSGLTAGPGH